MMDVIVKVMVEVLNILAIATREINQHRASESILGDRSTTSTYCSSETFLKMLVGRTDLEDALQRLEEVTLEEARMAAAEALKAIHGVGTKVGDTLKAMEDRMRSLEGMLQGVGDRLQGVDGRVRDISGKVINSAQTVPLVTTALIISTVRC
jgi:pyruvate-formate lyase